MSASMMAAEMDTEDLADFLLSKGICSEVADNFLKNQINGQAFLKLTQEDLKELAPLIGIRTQVRDILKDLTKVKLHFSYYYYCLLSLQGDTSSSLGDTPTRISTPGSETVNSRVTLETSMVCIIRAATRTHVCTELYYFSG